MEDYYFTLQLNITNLCNLRCTHCYHGDHLPHGKLAFKDYCGVLQQFINLCSQWNVRPSLIICGGEPFLYKQLDALCQYYDSTSHGGELSILTNATLVTSENILPYTTLNIRMIQVSLDGASAATHDRMRGEGNFEKTIGGIRTIIETGLPVSINAVLTRKNYGEIEHFFLLAKKMHIPRVTFTRFVPIGIGKAIDDQMLTPHELKDAYLKIVHCSRKHLIDSNFHDGLFHLIDPSLGAKSPTGYTAVTIADDGTILLTSRTPIALGNILTDNLGEIWLNHPILRAVRDRANHQCCSCPHFESCGGNEEINFAYWGQFHRTDPQCWLAYNDLPKRPWPKDTSHPKHFSNDFSSELQSTIWGINNVATNC